jgi:hypothetical protein
MDMTIMVMVVRDITIFCHYNGYKVAVNWLQIGKYLLKQNEWNSKSAFYLILQNNNYVGYCSTNKGT